MEIHYGQIAETVVRRNCQSITQFASLIDVNRRSVYNWFKQKDLSPAIIYKIGVAINHDFSVEMPKLFSAEDFKENKSLSPAESKVEVAWKDKYLDLLDDYTVLLTKADLNSADESSPDK